MVPRSAMSSKPPELLDHSEYESSEPELIVHLKFFLAFMLGIRLAFAYIRFQRLIHNVDQLFEKVLSLHSDIETFRVRKRERSKIARYSVLSCWLYYYELAEL